MADQFDLRGPWSPIRRAPMLRFGMAFIVGVSIGLVWPLSTSWSTWTLGVASALVLLVLLVERPTWRLFHAAAVYGWAFLFGLCWTGMRVYTMPPDHVSQVQPSGPWVVRIQVVNGSSPRSLRAEGELLRQWGGTRMEPRSGAVMLTLLLDSGRALPQLGDVLLVDAEVEPIDRVPDPGGFDRRAWAASRGIAHELLVPADRWRKVGQLGHWTDAFTHAREAVSHWLNGSGLARPERAMVKALVLGQRDELDGDQKEAFMRSGTIHVLAVSGMHVGLIYAVLTFVIGGLGAHPRWKYARGALVLLALWGYAGLTGAAPSVMRATVMFTLFTVSNMAMQRTDHLNSLFAAAVVLLTWDPRMLFSIGFQLSFLAVLGIILFYKPIERLWSPGSWLLRQMWSLAIVSISAQLLTTPLSLYLFKAFPIWFLPANIVVVVASSFAVYGGVALVLLYKVPLLGWVITKAMELLLLIVGHSTAWFAALPAAYPPVRVDGLQMVLLYALVLTVGAWWWWLWKPMRTVSILLALVLAWTWSARLQQRMGQKSFVVYGTNRSLEASMVVGRTLVAFSSDDPYHLERLERHVRHVGPHTVLVQDRELLSADRSVQAGPTLLGGDRWVTPSLKVAFLRTPMDELKLPEGERFDAVVVSGIHRLEQDVLDRLVTRTDQVVLSADLRWRLRARLMEHCQASGVPCHDVREQGAFILQR